MNFVANTWVLLCYLTIFNRSFEFHIHRFLATLLLDVSWDGSAVLVQRGFLLNRAALTVASERFGFTATTMLLTGVLIYVPFGSALLIPLGVVIFPLVSSLLYVSFRDIYLGIAENSPVKAPERQGLLALSAHRIKDLYSDAKGETHDPTSYADKTPATP